MTAMLASVRNLDEATLVAAGGVDWIDLKEPADGALGAVPIEVIASVARRYVASHRLSATIGDCWDTPALIPQRVAAAAAAGAQYVKVGAWAAAPDAALLAALRAACEIPAQVIVVCFAEAAPAPDALDALAATGIVGVMLDTAIKHGPSLRELLAPVELERFVVTARGHGLLTGLAGRLREEDVAPLLHHAPDYLGFRGALCGAGERTGDIEPARVAALRRRVAGLHPSPATEEIPHGLA